MEEIQRKLLTIIFLYPEHRYKIFKQLQERHFSGQYKTIFSACNKLYKQDKEIDAVIVISIIGTEYEMTIVELLDMSLINKPNVNEYIKMLVEQHNNQQAINKTKELLLKVEKGELTQKEIQNQYINISKVFDDNSISNRIFDTLQGFSMVLDEIESKKEYLKTGFKKLDEYVFIDKGDLIILAGKPSSGKTTMAVNISMNMSAKNKVLFFSLETSAVKIYKKIASSAGSISYNSILKSNLLDSDYSSFLNAANEFSKYSLKVIEAAGMTVDDMAAIALQEKADIIFIDYMQIVSDKTAKSIYERVTNISKDLHILAQKEKIAIVALSQLRRTDKKEPVMSDLRESGQIEQDADAIIFIHNKEDSEEINKQTREIIIAKNKQGEIGKLDFKFYGRVQTFDEA